MHRLTDRTELLNHLPHNSIVAEIGVARGNYSQEILSITHPQKLYLIDCWSTKDPDKWGSIEQIQDRFTEGINDGVVKIHKAFAERAMRRYTDAYFDWVYLDTNHDYESTLRQLILIEPKIREDGYICGHDYCAGSDNMRYGVIQAVDEFCRDHRWEMIWITDERFASYALRRKMT